MIIPIRCFSCGKPIAHLWESYVDRVQKGEERKKVMDELGLQRYCCRTMFMTNKDVLKDIAVFKV